MKFLHIWHVCDVENVSTYLQFMHFCCEVCFVAIYALSCGEKFNKKMPLWRKNDKYEVCVSEGILNFLIAVEIPSAIKNKYST